MIHNILLGLNYDSLAQKCALANTPYFTHLTENQLTQGNRVCEKANLLGLKTKDYSTLYWFQTAD